jgi:hypothetical protein
MTSHALPVWSFAIGMALGILVAILVIRRLPFAEEPLVVLLRHVVALRRTPGAAAPKSLTLQGEPMINVDVLLLEFKEKLIELGIDAAANNTATFSKIVTTVADKLGDQLDVKAKAALAAFIANESALIQELAVEFEPQANAYIDSQFAKLESEAGSEENVLDAKALLWLKAEDVYTKAQIAAAQASAAAPSTASLPYPVALAPEDTELLKS